MCWNNVFEVVQFLVHDQRNADPFQVRLQRFPALVRPALESRWGDGVPRPTGAASPGPAHPRAGPRRVFPSAVGQPDRCPGFGSSPGRSRGGLISLPASTQVGIWRKSACHTSYSCVQVLGQPLLDEAERPLRLRLCPFWASPCSARSQAMAPGVDFQPARKLPMYSRASLSSPGL